MSQDIRDFKGVIPAVLSVFDKDENLDEQGTRELIRHLLSYDIGGLYITGSTGETFLMDSAERKRQVHCQAHALVSAGDVRGAVKLLRDALRLYVNDSGLMLALTETLAHLDDPEAVEEAVRLGERALKKADISMKARCTATANLIFLCLKTGRNQRAAELAASLPHIWESREMLAPELLAGAEYMPGLKEAIMKALAFLCRRIDASSGHVPGAIPDYVQLGADLQTELTPTELLEKIRDFLI